MQDSSNDSRITNYIELISPINAILPVTSNTVSISRSEVSDIIQGRDKRLIIFVGPCSIHNESSAIEFASRLKILQRDLPQLLLIMRFFIQKPRTTVGWTGFLDDPNMDGGNDIVSGLERTIKLAHIITDEIKQPICTELLGSTIEPQYINPYLTTGFIGARTSESQIHRNLASGVSFPIGIKNPSDGQARVAYQGVQAARVPRSFCGIKPNGKICAVHTTGNKDAFAVLRGSYQNGSNIDKGIEELKNHEVAIVVDCAHGNSNKILDVQYDNALRVSKSAHVCGIMIESHIKSGKQKPGPNADPDISVTDPCMCWERTESLLRIIAKNQE
uniref:3-deoxy-7-phosphoheptulonate synthase n=1 Tax=viral metagenome TaxID=1070528 RepID=A0A6C0LYK1_9ZZZZ